MVRHATNPMSGSPRSGHRAGRTLRWEKTLSYVRFSVLPAAGTALHRRAGAAVIVNAAQPGNDENVIIYNHLRIAGHYWAVASPYQERYKTVRPRLVSGDCATEAEAVCFGAPARCGSRMRPACRPHRRGVRPGFAPGAEADATPACAIAGIAGSLVFGDIDDPGAEVTRVIATTRHFRRHEQLGTGPGRNYLWE